jgi:uncharacterized protein (TIGR03435 family)
MTRPGTQVNLILLLVSSLYGQTAPVGNASAGAAFEVASIKPSDPNASGSQSNSDGRLVSMRNWTTHRLLQRAFDVQSYQVTGGPNWLDSLGFDINAKVSESEPVLRGKEGLQRVQMMLQALLRERFQLESHKETRTLPVYHLTASKSGVKLTASASAEGSSMNSKNGHLTAEGISVAQLAAFLSRTMERPVLDATGIPGRFDFALSWSPQEVAAKAPDGNESAGPSIFTALQEQLGLKLESGKGPVEIIVVDHAEKPTDN